MALVYFCPLMILGQVNEISGVVLDSISGEPLPFVNIIVNQSSYGTTADIDGKFTVQFKAEITSLTFSYVGYKTLILEGNALSKKNMTVRLSSSNISMDEVVVLPGENPAHRIIKNATDNRKKNAPEELPSFSYTSYNKMYFTAEIDSKDDSASVELKDFFSQQHLFLSESVSERKYRSPGMNNEKVIASRVSGFKDPTFSVLATEFQSFSFYNDYFTLGDKNYLNPISKGSTNKYFFLLEDTLYKGADTTFVISYQSKKGKNFDALEGLIYITTDGWAIQNVTAKAVDAKNVSLSIQQQYEKVEGQWFPVQLNTDMVLKTLDLNGSHIKGVGRAYLEDIKINPELKRNEFSQVELEILPDATNKSEEFWDNYRHDTLTFKDKKTYHVIDSIGKEAKLDQKIKVFTSLSTGKYPIGKFDIDLKRILAFNTYESVRLGFGVHTNDRLSRFFAVGGWLGYGFKDKGLKYGGDVQFNLHRNSELAIKVAYSLDIPEAGRPVLAMDRKLNIQEVYRNYHLGRRDLMEELRFSIGWRMLKYLKVETGLVRQNVEVTDDYFYGFQSENVTASFTQFNFTEAFVGLRYAFREKILRTKDTDISYGTKFPVLWVTASKGLTNVWGGAYDYIKIDGKLEHSFIIRNLGVETYQLSAGYVNTAVPYTKLYKGKGNQQKIPVASANAFETMGVNEFLADRYITFFHTHNFGSLLLKTEKFSPTFILVNNIGFGWLSNSENHFNVSNRSFDRGYFETGLRIDNILKLNFSGFGAGVFYRYGGYQNPELKDNLAVKFSMTFVL